MRHRSKWVAPCRSYLDVSPHAVGQYSHQYRYCGMSHFFASLCFFQKNKLVLWNKLTPTNTVRLHRLKWWTLSEPSSDTSCVCVLFALADDSSNGSLGFYVDEVWQDQALFLRVFITSVTRCCGLVKRDTWWRWTERIQQEESDKKNFRLRDTICPK